MLLSPWFWAVIAALCIGSYVAGCTHEHGEVVKVKAQWEAEKREVADNEARIKAERDKADADAATEDARREAVRQASFTDLQKRHDTLRSKLSACAVDRDVLNGLLDTVHTANAAVERAPEPPAKDTAAPARPTTFNQWFDTVAQLYDACVDEVIDWNKWYDGQKGSQ